METEKKLNLTESDLKDYAIALERLRQANKNDIRESQATAHSLLTSAWSSLNKNLFLVASLFIPLISSFVINSDVRSLMGQSGILLIKEALVLTIASIAFGFLHIIAESRYYDKWLEISDKRLRLWSQTSFWPGIPTDFPRYINEYETIRKESDGIQETIPKRNTSVPILFQGTSLFLSVIVICVLVFELMSK